MPAAAVIPAPIAYIKVVAVKKLVVEILLSENGSSLRVCSRCHLCISPICTGLTGVDIAEPVTLKKLECFKQA